MSENIQNTTTEQIETLEQQLAKIHLRPRLAKFCENILCKKTRAKSYTEAGFKAKNDNVANVQACRILQIPKIKEYIRLRELQEFERLKAATSITREWVISQLQEIVEQCKDGKPRERTAALAEINKMQGYLAPTKVETTSKHKLDLDKVSNDDVIAFNKRIERLAEGLAEAKAQSGNGSLDKVDPEKPAIETSEPLKQDKNATTEIPADAVH